MSNVSYPYDDSGHAATNLIQGEIQVLTLGNNTPYRYFIPTFAPFYETNFKLFGRDALGNERELIRNVDYNFNLTFIGATRGNGAAVWGGVNIINQTVQGPVKLNYQCLGGKYSADRDFVVRTIAENNYNPRVVAWDQVTSIQELFPPSRHPQDLDTFTGYRDLIDAVQNYHDHPDEFQTLKDLIWNHMLNVNDPHETKKLLGEYALKEDVNYNDKVIRELINQLTERTNELEENINNVDARVGRLEGTVEKLAREAVRIVESIPLEYISHTIVVEKPYSRMFVWNGQKSSYERAPWNRPGMLVYSYHNPASIVGYLPVRGDISYNKKDYPELCSELGITGDGTFTLVEMRGEFLRVLDNGRGVDIDRSLRSSQDSQNKAHSHDAEVTGTSFVIDRKLYLLGAPYHNAGGVDNGTHSPDFPVLSADVQLNHTHTISIKTSGESESRPRNIAVPLWISY